MNVRILILLVILFLADLYVFQGLRFLVQHKSLTAQKVITIVYWTLSAVCLGVILIGQFVDWHHWPQVLRSYSFAIIVIVYLSKIVVIPFLLVDDLVRVIRWTGTQAASLFEKTSSGSVSARGITRLDFLVKLGFIIGAVPFSSLIYGMIKGAYDYRVRKVKLKFSNLPHAFEGIRLVQISDLHTGSFFGPEHLNQAIDLILEQKPDVIFFTGDLVNDRVSEVIPYRSVLGRIQAPLGVYSILGNHDYGDYYRWETIEQKTENLRMLKEFQKDLGWKLLLNAHTYIEKESERIGLIGVENWSARSAFSRYGNMETATHGMNPAGVNLLLSHDPSHWNAEITEKYPFVDLTLSGHTHGFQFGVEIPGFKWSPVQYMYRQWAGLYRNEKQYLYVNRGLGFIGYPGRVGILPEITVFEFNKA